MLEISSPLIMPPFMEIWPREQPFRFGFRRMIAADTPLGTTITNTGVVRWNNPQQSDSATSALDVGGTPGSAALNGRIWHDESLDLVYTADNENPQLDWRVELYLNNLFVTSVTTDSDGLYHLTGTASKCKTSAVFMNFGFMHPEPESIPRQWVTLILFSPMAPRLLPISGVVEGGNLQNLNLPLWPNGTIYNSVARVAVAGAGLKMVNAVTGVELPELCFDDPVQQNQVTTQNGFYKFDLNFSNAACPPGGSYLIDVTAPATVIWLLHR